MPKITQQLIAATLMALVKLFFCYYLGGGKKENILQHNPTAKFCFKNFKKAFLVCIIFVMRVRERTKQLKDMCSMRYFLKGLSR
jgi:hypothetical protein